MSGIIYGTLMTLALVLLLSTMIGLILSNRAWNKYYQGFLSAEGKKRREIEAANAAGVSFNYHEQLMASFARTRYVFDWADWYLAGWMPLKFINAKKKYEELVLKPIAALRPIKETKDEAIKTL